MKINSPLTLFLILCLFSVNRIKAQEYFAPVGNFTSAMNINLLEVKVDGINLIAGDEIGIYDGELCVGAIVLVDDLGELIDAKNKGGSAGADDAETAVQDGFVAGNTILFRIWDASENVEYTNVTATYIDLETEDVLNAPTFSVGATAFVSLSVNSNKKPTANAGNNQAISKGENGVIDGSASFDPEGETLSFLWTDFDNLGLNSLNDSVVSYKAPNVAVTTKYRIALVVNDGVNNSDPDTVIISVRIKNTKPVANAGVDFSINEGENGVLDGSLSEDPDEDEISYHWASDFLSLNNDELSSPVFTAPEVQKDTIVFVTLAVSDGNMISITDTVWVTIRQVNKAPVVKAEKMIVVNEGEEINLDASETFDPEGDQLIYKWEIDGIIKADTSAIVFSIVAPEVEEKVIIPVILSVTDGFNTVIDTISIIILQVNKSPFWVEIPSDSAFIGYQYAASISVSDPDLLDTLSIFSDNLPDWLTLTDYGDGTALVSSDSVPREVSILGIYSFTLNASDGIEIIESEIQLSVSIKTGIKSIGVGELSVYPNPGNGLVNIRIDYLPVNFAEIHIINQIGQLILTDKIYSQFQTVDISGYPSGLYFVKIVSPNFELTRKIILK